MSRLWWRVRGVLKCLVLGSGLHFESNLLHLQSYFFPKVSHMSNVTRQFFVTFDTSLA